MARTRATSTPKDKTKKPTTERARPRRVTKRAPKPAAPISNEEIALEAYHLFLARGGQNGDEVTDWLMAEQIVRERKKK